MIEEKKIQEALDNVQILNYPVLIHKGKRVYYDANNKHRGRHYIIAGFFCGDQIYITTAICSEKDTFTFDEGLNICRNRVRNIDRRIVVNSVEEFNNFCKTYQNAAPQKNKPHTRPNVAEVISTTEEKLETKV